MREVRIHRAEGIHTEDSVEPVVIRIDSDQPYPCRDFVERAAELFRADGAALAEAIWESCPGGTIDALIAALLAHRASTFRVRFPQEKSDA